MRALAALLAVLLAVAPASAGQIVNPQNNLCTIPAGGVITTAVGNVGGGEDNLMTYTLPANTLARNGDYVEVDMWMSMAANGNTKTAEPYFGATKAGWGGDTWNNTSTRITYKVVRTSATTQLMFAQLHKLSAGSVSTAYQTPTETLTGAVTIKLTGQSGSSATDDIIQRLMVVWVCTP